MTPITEFDLEQATYNLFAEWLKGYFDGATHRVGAVDAGPFPKAVLGFGQSVLPQPLNPVPALAPVNPAPVVAGITMVFAADTGTAVQRRSRLVTGQRQQLFYKPVRWNFFVRCETAGEAGRAVCLRTGQLLEALLANAAATHVLAQNGVHRVRPGSAVPVADNTYLLRMIPCRGVLRYGVQSQTS